MSVGYVGRRRAEVAESDPPPVRLERGIGFLKLHLPLHQALKCGLSFAQFLLPGFVNAAEVLGSAQGFHIEPQHAQTLALPAHNVIQSGEFVADFRQPFVDLVGEQGRREDLIQAGPAQRVIPGLPNRARPVILRPGRRALTS